MTKEEVLDQVSDIIRDVLDLPEQPITFDTTADDVDGWDSFNHINIVVATEDKFRVKFNTAELEELKNVGELVDLVMRKMGAR